MKKLLLAAIGLVNLLGEPVHATDIGVKQMALTTGRAGLKYRRIPVSCTPADILNATKTGFVDVRGDTHCLVISTVHVSNWRHGGGGKYTHHEELPPLSMGFVDPRVLISWLKRADRWAGGGGFKYTLKRGKKIGTWGLKVKNIIVKDEEADGRHDPEEGQFLPSLTTISYEATLIPVPKGVS